METLAVVILTLRRGMWATSLDLLDAYLHISISPESQRYLAFCYKGIFYKFTSLPFGLSTAPRVFTRVTRAVISVLRERGILLFAYLDDWLILEAHRNQALFAISETINLLVSLGWLINEKSHLTPSSSLTYLGARIDFRIGRVFPTERRIDSLKESIQNLLEDAFSPALAWLRVLGLMARIVDVLPLCRLRM